MRRAATALLAVAGLALPCCADRDDTTTTLVTGLGTSSRVVPTTSDGRVVLVTIDGVRWQDVFGGSDPSFSGAPSIPPEELMPHTYALLATRGMALGADREGCATVHTASGANVSLPGYQEIFTGRPSWCLDNNCARVSESVMDEAARAQVAGVASIGSWNVLDRATSNGNTHMLVAEGRRWPESGPTGAALDSLTFDALVTAGATADPMPGHDDYRPDAQTVPIALEYFRTAKPAFFHVGLGDTDEWGHRNDYGAYLQALHRADALIGDLVDAVDAVDALGELAGRTTIIVTPDHGRNSDFRDHGTLRIESGRTFLLAFGARVAGRGIGCPAHDITLADIAPTIRVLLGLPRDIGDGAGTPIELFTAPREPAEAGAM